METGDKTEGTLRHQRDGDGREVGCSRACMGEPPPNSLGGEDSAGLWQRTGAIGEAGPAHLVDTFRVALQPRLRTGSPWLVNNSVCSHFLGFTLMMTGAFVGKGIFRAQVGNI